MLNRQDSSLNQMLQRQESSVSSSRREAPVTPPTPETHHAKAIGCMSGILQLFSKYQNRNKLLTAGKKQKENAASLTPSNAKASASVTESQNLGSKGTTSNAIPRSPSLPSEIRRSNAAGAGNSLESRKRPSSLVARLMGLEELNYPVLKKPETGEDDPIAEKRKKILQALDKCNEDLEALKKIIRRVQCSSDQKQLLSPVPPPTTARSADGDGAENGDSWEMKTEELSPVCVLDEFTLSPLSSFSKVNNNGAARMTQQRKPNSTKKPGEDDHTIVYQSLFRIKREATVSHGWGTMAKLQSVDEVCSDVEWGEKREVGRIGLGFEDNICKDLIEEFVKELMKCCRKYSSLPFEACKRRLSF